MGEKKRGWLNIFSKNGGESVEIPKGMTLEEAQKKDIIPKKTKGKMLGGKAGRKVWILEDNQ